MASLALGLGGCAQLRYVTQASAGQAELLDRQLPIDELVRGGHLAPRTRALLARVGAIKAFGERRGLRATSSYTHYVNLERPAVVWVVSACDPLAFRSKVWSFPVTGSIPYLGWFREGEAQTFAAELRGEGWDVDLRGASAYSTLGWFNDPVLSTMLVPGEAGLGELADVILHESLHATYFIKSQSALNESLASFVGNRLAGVYLDEALGHDSPEKRAYVALEQRAAARGAEMRAAYERLEAVYASPVAPAVKLREKARVLSALRDRSREGGVNNATLIQYETYGAGEPELARLFASCAGDWARFLRVLDRARPAFGAAPPHAEPAELLAPLVRAGCPR
ncbi:MAG: aminopeptidase [Myxococcales bacterium]|nr:aminopeptidase [Myxococcales bacterium]